MGGCIAFEMATQLQRAGEQVEVVVLIDSFARLFSAEQSAPDAQQEVRLAALFYQDVLRAAGQDSALSQDALARMQPQERLVALEKAGQSAASALGIGPEPLEAQHRVFKANLRAALSYTPQVYAGSVICFEATDSPQDHGWQAFVADDLVTHRLEADHYSILRSPVVETLAAQLRIYLDRSPLPSTAGASTVGERERTLPVRQGRHAF
jgi:thioesterase domain-containing protein